MRNYLIAQVYSQLFFLHFCFRKNTLVAQFPVALFIATPSPGLIKCRKPYNKMTDAVHHLFFAAFTVLDTEKDAHPQAAV